MSWNYRIVKIKHKFPEHMMKDPIFQENIKQGNIVEYTYGIHEVYYDKNDEFIARTKEPIIGCFESLEELIISINMMFSDIEKYPEIINDECVEWKGFDD